jgi:hypothetical protein
MKKKVFKVMSALMVLLLVATMTQSVFVSAKDNLAKPNYDDWKNATSGEIEFPITPDNEKWSELNSHSEMISACEVPNELIDQMSTQDLVDLVLQYPLLGEILAYTTYDQGLEAVKAEFNGLQELYSREDVAEVLLDTYCSKDVTEKSHVNSNDRKELERIRKKDGINNELDKIISTDVLNEEVTQDMDDIITMTFLETIIAQDDIISKFDENELKTLSSEAEKKYKEKSNFEVLNGFEDTFYEEALVNDNLDCLK